MNDNTSTRATLKPVYDRIVIKLSGEAMAPPGSSGIDPTQAAFIARTIKDIYDLGVQIGIVIGAGNVWRGSVGVEYGMDQSTADHMGMIATVMNGLALQDALQREGVETRVQTAIEMNKVAEPYIRGRAIRHMEKNRVVIMTGGTGNPYFTTDTAGVLRAMEINADVIIKATKVDGIYTEDPKKNPDARRFEELTYQDAVEHRVRVMDMTAIAMCMDNHLRLIVLDFWKERNLLRAVCGEKVGTMVVE